MINDDIKSIKCVCAYVCMCVCVYGFCVEYITVIIGFHLQKLQFKHFFYT